MSFFLRSAVISCILMMSMLPPGHQQSSKNSAVIEVQDPKEMKRLLKTTPNLLCLFVSNARESRELRQIVWQTAEQVRGVGSVVYVDCSGEGRKICKKYKVIPEPSALKHFHNGVFHKDYDRLNTVSSMVNFMRAPTSGIPWHEDANAADVIHLTNAQDLAQLLRQKPSALVMFYVPWCSFCNQLKPDYSAVARELQGEHVLAAMDVDRPENHPIRQRYNITAFPTILYFVGEYVEYTYGHDYNKDGLRNFMANPGEAPAKPKETVWSDSPSDVVHLTDASFDDYVRSHSSLLLMLYAPWCGHCKTMKPQYEEAATALKLKGRPGVLAAVDATKEKMLAARFDINGYPTVKYLSYGKPQFNVNVRDKEKILEFMADPRETPALTGTGKDATVERVWSEEASDVHHLGEDSFRPLLKKKKHVLVMFYAPWCGHCKKAKPEFQAAATEFADDPKVELAAVDCTQEAAVCKLQDVKGYPTFKYYSYLKVSKPYEGGRTKADFVKFLRDPSHPLSSAPAVLRPADEWSGLAGAAQLLHLTDSTFDQLAPKQLHMLVMFFAPWCGHCKTMKAAYAAAAARLKVSSTAAVLATVDATVENQLKTRFDIRGFPTLKYFRNGKFVKDYSGQRTEDALVSFMASQSRQKDEL